MLNRLHFSAFLDPGNTTIAVWAIVLVYTAASCCSPAIAQAVNAPDARANTVLEAIRRHGEATQSLVFEWTDTPNAAVGDDVTARAMRHRDDAVKSTNPADHENAMSLARVMIQDQQRGTYRLVVDGARMRFEESGFEASLTAPLTVVPQEIVRTFDGKVGKSLVAKSAGRYPRGTVGETNQTHALDFVGSLPIVVAIRGAVWLDRLAPVPTTLINGVLANDAMIILTLSSHRNRSTWSLWCDPARDYHVMRIECHARSVLRFRYDISYSRHESGQWIPIRWTRMLFGPGGTIKQHKISEVTHYSIGRAISPEEFDLSFPPGTWVSDAVNERSYILLEDGGERVVTPAEQAAGLSYKEILAGTTGTNSQALWWMLLISTIALIGLLFFFWRGRRGGVAPVFY